ncbi:mandelate racemase/muconate lactonizing enzyme family protein [Microbacterium pygmaeum]|uniref:Galactonate dehydratase n=1 Tax=Microbacterium pygmaeum TaxID=370764 RepID=A0A1G7YNA7_9MICO|nr:mandelate racemase/muconate lactonizing enzyme family protein [Microbacterium pygmaeum]SDG97719.1 galactonate dehydratase [Microbacterium pygmaeum]
MRSAIPIAEVQTFVSGPSVFVRVTTESGVRGIGESTAFAFPLAVVAVVDALRPALVGADALQTTDLWLRMYRALGWRGITLGGAISAIDQALWDIRGRVFEEPVWQLLGGRVRRAVRAMKVLPTGTLEEVVGHARQAQDEGYTAVKVLLHQHDHHTMGHAARISDLVGRMAAIREATGDDLDLGVELHRNMQPGNSIALIRELATYRPLFVEDPIPPDSALSFGEVSAKSDVPMAAGERNTTIYEFREYVEKAGVSFIRPDVGIAGGFTHMTKICALAEAHHQGIIPHAVPSGPVATMAHVHLGIAVPNWEVQEHVDQERDPFTRMVDQVPRVIDGYLHPIDAPGLGMELRDDDLRAGEVAVFPVAPDLRADGSVAIR